MNPFDHRFVVAEKDLDAFTVMARPFVVDHLWEQAGHHGVAVYAFGRHEPQWFGLRALDCRDSISPDLAQSLLA